MTRSLTNAANALIAYRNKEGAVQKDINLAAWSATYANCGTEAVKAAIEAAMTDHSRHPQNTYCEGK